MLIVNLFISFVFLSSFVLLTSSIDADETLSTNTPMDKTNEANKCLDPNLLGESQFFLCNA